MLVIYILSFQGPNGGVTFPMVGFSTALVPGRVQARAQMANIPASFSRSIDARRRSSAVLTVVFSVAAGAGLPPALSGFGRGVLPRRRQPRDAESAGRLRHRPRLPGCSVWNTDLFTSALGAQLTWTLPFGLFAMFAVVNRFNRSLRGGRERSRRHARGSACAYVTLPILLPGIIGVAHGRFTLSYDEYARTTLAIGGATRCRSRSTR